MDYACWITNPQKLRNKKLPNIPDNLSLLSISKSNIIYFLFLPNFINQVQDLKPEKLLKLINVWKIIRLLINTYSNIYELDI